MLLRQLCLSHYEARRFRPALRVALQAIDLDVLVDVLHQDAARAALAAGDIDAATAHLRAAARRGPASRRAFHFWTLGSTLFLAGRYASAIVALERAVRWGTRDKALYRAHLALVRLAANEHVENLQETIDALVGARPRGYEQFLLGHLAYASGAWPAARRYLGEFVRRVGAGSPLVALALGGELSMARATLATMSAN
jgi:tetratricopeptide (TPR) repeat protein